MHCLLNPLYLQHTPSSYLAEMRLTTAEKLAQTQEMHPPRIVELLDIAETSHQKVEQGWEFVGSNGGRML